MPLTFDSSEGTKAYSRGCKPTEVENELVKLQRSDSILARHIAVVPRGLSLASQCVPWARAHGLALPPLCGCLEQTINFDARRFHVRRKIIGTRQSELQTILQKSE